MSQKKKNKTKQNKYHTHSPGNPKKKIWERKRAQERKRKEKLAKATC